MKKLENTRMVTLLGARIRATRKAKKLSQEKLAEMAGLHPTYVGDIERGQVNASLRCYADIAEALGTPLPELLDFQPDENEILRGEVRSIMDRVSMLDEKRRTAFLEGIKALLHVIESI